MQNIINVYKPVGLTPLEIIQKLKLTNKSLLQTKICYAGRLDPLAHGVLLLLTGEEIKQFKTYLNLTKEYEFEVAFGLQTDTYDLLGYLTGINLLNNIEIVNTFVNTFVSTFTGIRQQSYPPFSSKTVGGKPLFWWARNDKLSEIEIPKREIEIYEFRCLSIGELDLRALEMKIKNTLTGINGDFRQAEIIKRWDTFFSNANNTRKLTTAKFYIRCSSGTYVRELVNQMGKEISYGAVATEILRTKVGNYSLADAISI